MIWGEAGIGKSTFCQKLSQDWALVVTQRKGTEVDRLTEEQRRTLNNIGLLFYIVLRETNSDQTLEQILTSQLGLLEGHLEMLKSYKGNVTLLLDGFDELSYNKGHIIELIQGKLIHNNTCIITCRPHASQGIILNSDSEIKLKGFSESQSKAFIEMFARNRFKKEKDVNLFISKTWKEITSSIDLIEMSTNPSMLQLICLLSAQTGKIGKDRAKVFKHYTQYLLIQYHTKHHEGVPYSDKLYKDDILKCGKLAMFGLKQNHLQLVFSKPEATEVAGPMIFNLGFLTELPSIDTDKVKVQFIHKSLQEYLAAFFVVNTPGDEGMKLLMEFSSTSQRLMGSQIILSFIAAMSTKMGKVIQNQIKDYISAWKTNDNVDPKSRTSFLIAMLKDNKKLTFPLPAVLDIDLQNYDSVTSRIMNFIKSLFGQKSTLDRFINMDGRGVKKINIGVGQYNRLSLLLNNSFTSLEELLISYRKTWSKDDPTHISEFITKNIPSLISITSCAYSLFNKDLITKVILTERVHTVTLKKCQISKENCLLILQRGHHLKNLIMQECGIEIDAEIARAVCGLPDETKIDLSGNKIIKMSTKLLASLIVKINTQKQIDLSGLNIDIDIEIAKAVCDLPGETQIDLSGNKIVKMDKKLLISLIYKIRKQKQIDLGGVNIDIDSEIAKAVCDLPDETQIDLSGNKISRLDRIILEIIVTKIRKDKQTDDTRFNIQVDDKLVNAICDIPGDTQSDLSENKIFQINSRILMSLIYKINTLKEINLSGLNIKIDGEVAKTVCDLPDETQIDLSGNKIVKMDKKLLISLIYKIRKQKQIDLEGANIDIDSEIAKAVCDLPGETQIDLSGNKIVKMDKKLLISLIYKIRKQKQIDLGGANIDIDSEIAKAVCDLPDESQIDLSGNKIVKMDKKVLISLIYKIKKQKQIDLGGANIDIDSEIAKAVCDLPDETQIDLSGNKIVKMDKKLLISLIYKIKKQKQIDLGGANIDIDSEIAKAVCDLPDETQIDLSGNKINRLDRIILEIIVTKIRKDKQIDDTRFNIQVDDKLVNAICDIPGDTQLDLSENKIFQINSRILMSLIYKINTLKEINLSGLNIKIDGEVAKTVCDLPDETQIDLSGNKIVKMDKKLLISLIYKIRKQKQIDLGGANIDIDSEIAKAVCDLPGETQIDLSGNKIVKMDKKLLISLIYKIKKQKQIDLGGANIDIDSEIAKAVCDLPDETQIDLSGNKIVKMDKKLLISLIYKIRKQKQIDLGGANIDIDSEIAKAVCDLPGETQIDLSGNKIVKMDKKLLISLIYKIKKQKQIDLGGANIDIDSEIAKAVCDLPDETQIDLSGNKIVKMDKKLLISLIYKIKKQKQIDLGGANIDIDSEIAKAVCDLPDETQIDLSGNKINRLDRIILEIIVTKIRKDKQIDDTRFNIQVDDKLVNAICDIPGDTQLDLSENKIFQINSRILMSLIYKINTLKEINLSGLNIKIDGKVAKTVCDLPDETQIDLSGNKIVKMDKKLLISLIYKIRKQKQIDLGGANIDIDSEIAKAVCDLPDETQIDLSGNKISRLDRIILEIIVTKIRKDKQIDDTRFNIQVDDKLVNAICDIPGDTQLDLSENKIFQINSRILMSLIYKINTLKEINLSGLNIKIDGKVAKTVCDLPDETQIDLSGNKIVKMDKKLLISLIYKIRKQKQIDLGGANIDIDSEIAKAVCDLPDETQIDLSGNKISRLDRIILEIIVTKIRKDKQIDDTRFNIQVDDKLVNAICDIPGDTQLDLSENKIFQINSRILMSLIYKINTLKEINLSGLNIKIDGEVAKTVCDLPGETQIDLSGNKISRLDRIILGLIVTKIRKEKEINVTRFNFQVDSKLINAIHEIPGDRELDLSKNKIFQINPRILMTLIYKIHTMKEIDMSGLNINIDTELVKCISQLPEDVQIDLSGNKITKMEARLLVKVLKYMKKQEEINIYEWGITIDVDIVKALSNMVYLKYLMLSYNTLTPSACKCLLNSVKSLPQLEEVYLGYCGISNDDCVDLVSSLSKHCPRLEVLSLSYNHLSSGISQVVDDVSKMNNLRRLGLSRNPCMKGWLKEEEIKNRLKISNPQLYVYTGYL